MRPARVVAVEPLSPHFRLIDLEGDALKDVTWALGQKVQVAMGSGLAARTYTPMSWDADRGATRLLAFAHGDGPGSRWTTGLQVGDTCQFFGPRRSLDLSGLGRPVMLFGDETSFGLAASLRESPQGGDARFVFEVSDAGESRPVLAAFGLGDAIVVERAADDTHLAEAEDRLVGHVAAGGDFILTGKAPSIQRVSRALKAAGIGSARLKAKAYWAPGKTGLD
ncbi:siderophore-interacting protein [Stakelama tenebrarum]|uniref:Siderophore-interacting protein n=1 Tax=Stakelama tenebrarum TaxID=2711215 RepID=A0A6G6Y0W2_9SPHN|nr:siderophore-interacting protein [Sphingosinithalassobacter tenebrarum]QIG78562.1 siderophore-interacting protein [Sphingosinithalassobacter tenebrarum]